MPIRKEHAPALIAGAFVAGLAIVGIVVALSGGDGDDTRAIDTERSTTSSSSSTSTSTSSTTTTTLPPVTIPPTSPPTPPPTPGTIIVVPTVPPTSPPTSPPSSSTSSTSTSSTSSTTSTTQPQTPDEQEIQLAIETALSTDGTLPPDDARRVFVDHPGDQTPPTLRVTVGLDDQLTTDEQLVAARVDAFTTLKTLQGLAQFTEDQVILRLRLPDEDGDPTVVVRLEFDRDTLLGIDFDTIDPLSIFTLADDANFFPPPDLEPTPTTTTSSTSP